MFYRFFIVFIGQLLLFMGWEWLGMVRNDWEWLEKVGKGWKRLKMVGKG